MAGYERHFDVGLEVKTQLARMTGLQADDFALIGNASEGIVLVLSSIDWRPGDNAVVSSLDFESGRFALAGLAGQGVTTRFVPTRGWLLDISDLLDACDARTRVVYLSLVNALTGQRIDLKPISEALRQMDIILLVDASHALGIVPVDGALCDFLVSSTYKFLMGPQSGILAWNRRRRPDFVPRAVGWNSADPVEPWPVGCAPRSPTDTSKVYEMPATGRRAELGNPNHLDVYLLRESLGFLGKIPADDLGRHVEKTTDRIAAGLVDLGYEVITPMNPAQRGANVCFASKSPRDFVDAAARDGIYLWGGDGRVRASAAAFVEESDIDRLLDFAKPFRL